MITSMMGIDMIEYENLNKSNATFNEEYLRAFRKVLDSGWFILGSEVKRFEEEFARYCGVSSCIGVANGLDALTLSLVALNLPKGCEIIVPSNTYIATILAIVNAGMRPVLVEPDIKTYNIDPAKITEKITVNTRGMMIVHLYGKSCDMDPIIDICRVNKLALIEDCAQAHGATYKGKRVGSFGAFGAFSFYPTKNLGCLGDGGALTCNNPYLTERVLFLRNYGSKVKYHNEFSGVNSRLDEIQASFLQIKLQNLDDINNYKRKLASIYRSYLNKTDLILPVEDHNYFDVYHIFNIRHNKRDEIKEYLLSKNIKTEIHYPIPPHRQNAMKNIFNEQYPISEEIHSTTLSLPVSYGHTESEIETTAKELLSYFKIGYKSNIHSGALS
jgi:dTDP-4-amino-4,6-dideoxygalactose transaminase